MRHFLVLLASLILIGCGAPTQNSDIKPVSVIATPPSIAELSPANTPVNSVPFLMTVNGDNFGTAAVVFWNGVARRTVFITSKQLMVSLTAEDLQFAGLVQVYVLSGGMNSNTVEFDVTPQ
jgi:IPT/TIG domain